MITFMKVDRANLTVDKVFQDALTGTWPIPEGFFLHETQLIPLSSSAMERCQAWIICFIWRRTTMEPEPIEVTDHGK